MSHESSDSIGANNAFFYEPYLCTTFKIAIIARHSADDISAVLRPEQRIIDEALSFPTLDSSLLPTQTYQFLSELIHTGNYTTPLAHEAFDRIGRIMTL